jgi:hypothetical protein
LAVVSDTGATAQQHSQRRNNKTPDHIPTAPG